MTREEGLISIIIPTYNRAHIISYAVNSVINQTNPNWELIIVDDGSEDKTSEVLQDYLLDDRIQYFYQTNKGVSTARNYGAEVASGNYLIFLDSDDSFLPTLIDKLYEIEFYKEDIVFWQVVKKVDEETQIWKAENLGSFYNNMTATFLAGSVCFRKKLFLKVGGYDPKMAFGENYELGLRISSFKNLKIKNIEEPFLSYSIVTHTRFSYSLPVRLSSHLYQYKKHKEKYKNNRKEDAKMLYIIALALEKSNQRSEALQFYKKSWFRIPWNFKPLLKIIYLNFF